MKLRTSLRRLRNDLTRLWVHPIWSNLIAAGILAVLGYLSLYFRSFLNSLLPSLDVYVIGGLLAIGLALLLWRYSRATPKTLVFLSSGGTCRDPIAKAITTKLFESHKPKHPVTIRAAGLGPLDKKEASYAARSAIREMYDEDLLADHKPELLTAKLAAEADLILAMDKSLLERHKTSLSGWPDAYNGKLYLLKPFFGLEGDVIDPWPDGKDQVVLDRYKQCADELRGILTQHFDRLVKALHV